MLLLFLTRREDCEAQKTKCDAVGNGLMKRLRYCVSAIATLASCIEAARVNMASCSTQKQGSEI